MATINSVATVNFVYRTDYASRIYDTAMRVHPTMQLIESQGAPNGHEGSFVGSQFNYPMKFGNPQGISNSFSLSKNQASIIRGVQFQATAVQKYGNILVDGPSILKCKDDGAFGDLLRMSTDDTINAHLNALAFDIFRSSSGIRGQRASLTGNVIQLAVIDDARNFEIDQTIGGTPNANGTAQRAGSTAVTAVNLQLGQVAVASAAAITGFADNDYLFNYGDPAGMGGDSLGSMRGMEDSTPLIAPTSGDSFRGQDRSIYVERLAGTRLSVTTSTGQTIEESVGQGAILVNTVGGMTNYCSLNPINFWAVVRRGNARVEMAQAGGEMTYGFETAKISTPAGTLKLLSDPDCPTNRGRGFDLASHYIRRNGELIHIIDDDGNFHLRSSGSDSVETRTRSLLDYIQNNTRNHFVFQI